MPATQVEFTTPSDAHGWKRWLVYSPVARIVIFMVLMGIIGTVLVFVDRWLIGPATFQHTSGVLGSVTAGVVYLTTFTIPVIIAYLLLTRVIEHRWPRELSPRHLIRGFGLGWLGGFLLFSTIIAALWLAGSFHVTGTDAHAHWLLGLLVAGLGTGIGEELLFRGVLFRITEEGLGTWWALVVSALFFGGAHLGNPDATAWSGLAIAIEAGILFGLVYHVTRSLWPSIGLHAAWNFAEGSIYGVPDSGTRPDGLLLSTRTGPHWLSGGAFGVEASAVSVAICLVVSAVLLTLALRRGSIVPPAWRRRRARDIANVSAEAA